MGWYGERVVPRITNFALADKRTGEVRDRVCAGLTGDVLELGFGSGINTGH